MVTSSDAYSGIVYFHYPVDFQESAAQEIEDMEAKQIYPKVRVLVEDYSLVRKSQRAKNN
jgi:hypothetical protein